jgi:hypothetical protein
MRPEIIRPYLEKLLSESLGVPTVASDDEGRYRVRVGTSGFVVELLDSEPVVVRMWSPLATGMTKSVELLEMLNSLNATGLGLRAFFVDGMVVLATEILAETLDARELDFAGHLLVGAAERLGPELVEQHGGELPFSDQEAPAMAEPAERLAASAGYL